MFLKTFTIFAFLLLAFAVFTPAQAQTPVGAVMKVDGTAAIRRNDSKIFQNMVADMDVYMEDFIKTQADSGAMIHLIDDTELTLGADATLTIDEYVFDADDAARNKGRFSILRGSFLFVSGLITRKDDPDVKINTAYGLHRHQGAQQHHGLKHPCQFL